MKVKLDKKFPIASPPAAAWEFLQDLEAVAGCMPGAKLSEQVDENTHKGTVTVRLGPATMSFRGEIAVQDVDQAARSLRMLGKGTDSSGSSGVSMNMLASIEDTEDGSCALVGASEVSMSGKAVTFGGRMINTVADKILLQFAENFAARVAERQGPAAATGEVGERESNAGELNAIALVWAIVKDWLRSLFGRNKA